MAISYSASFSIQLPPGTHVSIKCVNVSLQIGPQRRAMFMLAGYRYRNNTGRKPDFHLTSRAVFTITEHKASTMAFNDLPAQQEADPITGFFGGIERNKEV